MHQIAVYVNASVQCGIGHMDLQTSCCCLIVMLRQPHKLRAKQKLHFGSWAAIKSQLPSCLNGIPTETTNQDLAISFVSLWHPHRETSRSGSHYKLLRSVATTTEVRTHAYVCWTSGPLDYLGRIHCVLPKRSVAFLTNSLNQCPNNLTDTRACSHPALRIQ